MSSGFVFGTHSRGELEGVHPRLVAIAERALELTVVDFGVHDGLRTLAEQREYVRTGVSRTMRSKHLAQADGYSHAVDLVPYIGGRLRWEWPPIYEIAKAVWQAFDELELDARPGRCAQLTWGGVWDHQLDELDPEDLEREVERYVQRRHELGRTAFLDGPHYQFDLVPT